MGNIFLKISKLHFSFFVVRGTFFSWGRKWAMMSWICISCWYLKSVVVKTLEMRLTYFCRHGGRSVTARLAQDDCCCSTCSAVGLKAKPEAWPEIGPFFSGMWQKLWQEHAQVQTLLLFYSTPWSSNGQVTQGVVSKCKTRRLYGLRNKQQTTLLFLFFTWFSWSEVTSLGRIWSTGIVRLRGEVLVEIPRAKFHVRCEVLIANCYAVRETIEFESSYQKNTEVSSCKLFPSITLLFEDTKFFQLFALSPAAILLNLY